MNRSWAKNRATSRRAGPRRDVTESITKRRRDVETTSGRDKEYI